jgi:hypothetical protein
MGKRNGSGQNHERERARQRLINAERAASAWRTEDISFCDVVIRLWPRLNYVELFERVQDAGRRRRERIRRLRERTRGGEYVVPAGAVARALLQALDTGWPA